jgi:hypothetical protein
MKTPDYTLAALNNLAVLLKLALERLNAPADVLGAHAEGDTDAVMAFLQNASPASQGDGWGDANRLDWLTTNGNAEKILLYPAWGFGNRANDKRPCIAEDIRAAIDAARQQTQSR